VILDAVSKADVRPTGPGGGQFDREERMSLGLRAFWAVVTTLSGVLLYLAIVCALPRGPIGY
jgi:hypothetical protein